MVTPPHSARALLRWLWRDYLRKRGGAFFAALILMSVEGATAGLLSFLVRPMFDTVFVGADRSAVVLVALALAGVFGCARWPDMASGSFWRGRPKACRRKCSRRC